MSSEVFLARQPIVDADLRVQGYELLFRDSATNRYSGADPTQASASVLTTASSVLDPDLLTAGRPVWANVGRELLMSGAVPILPPTHLVVEVLEDVERDADVVAACMRLKSLGYRVALDDVVRADPGDPLLRLADVVKIDWRSTTRQDRRAIAALARRNTTLLAEKVETRAEFDEARALGCVLFQGYFLSAPVVVQGRRVSASFQAWGGLLAAVSHQEMDFDVVEGHIRADPALTLRLLRLINSAAFGMRARINTVRHALVLLGAERLRRWVTLTALAEGVSDAPGELVTASALRARLCESLGQACGSREPPFALFLTGMLSQLDALLGAPMATALSGLRIPESVEQTLLGREGHLRDVLDAVVLWERGHWSGLADAAAKLGVELDRLPALYYDALAFAGNMTNSA